MGRILGRPDVNGSDFTAIRKSHLMNAFVKFIKINLRKVGVQKIDMSMPKE